TQRRLDEARRKGDIVYSPEVGQALSLLAAAIVIAFFAGPMTANLGRTLSVYLESADQFSVDSAALRAIAWRALTQVGGALAGAAVLFTLAGIAARYLQDMPTFTASKLAPQFDKLNPIAGAKRVFGKAALASFLKTLA